jgi:hypothetical protein
MSEQLSGVVAEHIRAVNAFDTDAIVATFANDARVNDAQREIVGIDAIRRWVQKELVGDRVTIKVQEVVDHYGDTIVRGLYDGSYDKTNLPKGSNLVELLPSSRRQDRQSHHCLQQTVSVLK